MDKEKILFSTSFILKIIAILTMTLDHLGLVLSMLWPTMPGLEFVYPTFRILGRIALPLFCFLIVEGVIHTHKFSKYLIRLSILATVVAVAEIIMENISSLGMGGFAREQGNIFIDLLLGALAIYGLNRKCYAWKLLVLPLIVIGTLSFLVYGLETYNDYIIYWLPFFLRSQYHIISMLLILGFYGARKITSFIFMNVYHTGFHDLDDTFSWRVSVNLFSALTILVVSFGIHAMATYMDQHFIFWLKQYQIWMWLSLLPILFYNGKSGYKKKWFQIFSYAYYPLHIPIIYGIVYLITLTIFGG